ncbi:MAG: hypothetical protein ABL879_08185 [Devosia sp.]
MPEIFLGIDRGVWLIGAGVILLGASILIGQRYDLFRQDPFQPILTNSGNKLPALAAIVFGFAGGALIFLGTRGR